MSPRAALPAVFVTLAVVWSGVTGAGYVWDDHGLVERNTLLAAPTWEGVFGSDLWRYTDGERTPYYRPLMTVSLLVDRALGGSPLVAHLHSLVWHLACVGLLYALVRPRGTGRAVVAALLAGLHPVATEAVTWVAARNDLLAAAGVLGALVAVDRGRPLWIGLAALAALLSKESAVLLLPLVGLWAWGRAAPLLRSSAPLVGAVAAWAALRGAADLVPLGELAADPNRTPGLLALQALRALGWLAIPWPLTGTANLTSPLTPLVAGGAALAAVGLALLAVRGGREARAWVGIALLTALPAGYGLWTYGTLGERYLYLPVFAVAAAVAVAVPLREWALAPVLLVAVVAIRARIPDWKDDATFFARAAERAPDSYSLYLLGTELRAQGEDERAYALFERSLASSPRAQHACRFVADTARRILPAPAFVASLPRWTAADCRASPGFDGPVATQLLAWGLVDEARAWVAGSVEDDPSGRLEIARIVLALHEGDLLGAAALERASERPPVDVRERVATLLLVQPALPIPAPAR